MLLTLRGNVVQVPSKKLAEEIMRIKIETHLYDDSSVSKTRRVFVASISGMGLAGGDNEKKKKKRTERTSWKHDRRLVVATLSVHSSADMSGDSKMN